MDWFDEINQLRGISILAVVSIHISSIFTQLNFSMISLSYIIIDSFSHFAVPSFIFISGFVLFNKYQKKFKKLNIKGVLDFYKRHLQFILIPYLIFSTIYLFIRVFSPTAQSMEFFSLNTTILAYLSGGIYYHLWFFVLIVQIYLLFPLIVNIYIKFYENKIALILGIVMSYFLSVIYSIYGGNSSPILTFFPCIGFFIYFLIGMELNKRYDHFKLKNFLKSYKYLIGLSILILILLVPYIFYWMEFSLFIQKDTNISDISHFSNPFLFISIIILFLSLIKLASSLKEILRIMDLLGKYSFGIYLIHPLIISLIIFIIQKQNIVYIASQVLYYPVMMILCTWVSLMLCTTLEKMPYGYIVIGLKQNKSRK